MPVQLRLFSARLTTVMDARSLDPHSLSDLLPLLALAKKNNYLWLQDFLNDEVTVVRSLCCCASAARERRRNHERGLSNNASSSCKMSLLAVLPDPRETDCGQTTQRSPPPNSRVSGNSAIPSSSKSSAITAATTRSGSIKSTPASRPRRLSTRVWPPVLSASTPLCD